MSFSALDVLVKWDVFIQQDSGHLFTKHQNTKISSLATDTTELNSTNLHAMRINTLDIYYGELMVGGKVDRVYSLFMWPGKYTFMVRSLLKGEFANLFNDVSV